MPFGHNSQSFLDVIDINGVNDRFLSILVDWMYEFYLMIDLPLDSNNDMPHVMARPFAVYKQLFDVFVLFRKKPCHQLSDHHTYVNVIFAWILICFLYQNKYA